MKKILFYYPSNKRSNSIETLIEELVNSGVNVVLLTTCEKGQLHESLEKNGIKTFSNPISKSSMLLYYIKQIWFLIRAIEY